MGRSPWSLLEMLGAPMPVRQLVEIMLPIARGLERAHEHGIVHRDLKASNVFVTSRGQVKILDFGEQEKRKIYSGVLR